MSQSLSGSVRSVRMIVVGDKGCGKTSLITTLVSSIFPESVPPVLQQVEVPPEETDDGVALSITDTSSAAEDRENVLKEVAQADVAILVYSVEDDEAFDKGRLDKWLQAITPVFSGPILVVGNKVELAAKGQADRTAALRANAAPLLDKYGKQIDFCWECSAKLNMNVSEIFNMAQHAVLYPLFPLYDTDKKELRPKFKLALSRVFRVFDADHDGALSDKELNAFQESCFGVKLQPADIAEVKAFLQRQGARLVTPRGISFEGFQVINKQFINRNRAETSWLVLRQFGYNDKLDIEVPPKAFTIERHPSQSVELNRRGIRFIKDIFFQFDKDKKGYLTEDDLEEIFSICPCAAHPWESDDVEENDASKAAVDQAFSFGSAQSRKLDSLKDFPDGVQTVKGCVTLEGWVAQWIMSALLQPSKTLLYLHYLGANLLPRQLAYVTRKRSIEDEGNDLQRVAIRAFVFGTDTVGKAQLLDSLTLKSASPARAERCTRSACAAVQPRGVGKSTSGNTYQNFHLVLTSISVESQQMLDVALGAEMHKCDLAIMMFDQNDDASVQFLSNIQRHIPETVPCVYLYHAASDDVSLIDMPSALSDAIALCQANSLASPLPIVFKDQNPGKLDRKFELLVTTALRPDVARPISSQRRAARLRKRYLNAALRISFVTVTVTGIAFGLYTAYKCFRTTSRSSDADNKTPATQISME